MADRICKDCAALNRFKWLPCDMHGIATNPKTCKHENTSKVLTHNGLLDATICHNCGILTNYITEGK